IRQPGRRADREKRVAFVTSPTFVTSPNEGEGARLPTTEAAVRADRLFCPAPNPSPSLGLVPNATGYPAPMPSFAHQSLNDFLASIAFKTPTPGGGAVASTVAALAAALAQMVVAYSAGKKSLAQHEPTLQSSLKTLERARQILLQLADEDA